MFTGEEREQALRAASGRWHGCAAGRARRPAAGGGGDVGRRHPGRRLDHDQPEHRQRRRDAVGRRLLLSLLGFNQGVEVGQGLVVAAGLPLLFLLRGTRWESRAGLSSSLAILVLGLVLLVERALL